MNPPKQSISVTKQSNDLDKNEKVKIANFRWFIFILSHVAKFTVSTAHASLGLTIVAMINHKNSSQVKPDEGISVSSILPSYLHVNWSEIQKDRMLQAYSWGSLAIAFYAGRIAEIYGPKRVMSTILFTVGFLNLTYPFLAAKTFWGAYAARVVIGFACGIATPTFYVIVSRWSCAYERTFSISVVTGGYVSACIVVHPIVGLLVSSDFLGGWPSVFYLVGALNVLVAIPWYFLVSDAPENHPMLSSEELTEILKHRSLKSAEKLKVPWAKMLTSPPILAYLTIPFTYDWLLYVVASQMPSYYEGMLNLSYKTNGLVNALPWILSLITSLLGSYLADKVRKTNRFSLTLVRKFFTLIALGGASFFFFLITQFNTSSVAVVAFVSISKGLGSVSVAGSGSANLDVCPSYAGTLAGFNVLLSSLASLAMNEAAAQIVGDEPTLQKWTTFFYLTASVNLAGVIIFLIFGSGKVAKWDPSYEHARRISENENDQHSIKFDNNLEDTNEKKKNIP